MLPPSSGYRRPRSLRTQCSSRVLPQRYMPYPKSSSAVYGTARNKRSTMAKPFARATSTPVPTVSNPPDNHRPSPPAPIQPITPSPTPERKNLKRKEVELEEEEAAAASAPMKRWRSEDVEVGAGEVVEAEPPWERDARMAREMLALASVEVAADHLAHPGYPQVRYEGREE